MQTLGPLLVRVVRRLALRRRDRKFTSRSLHLRSVVDISKSEVRFLAILPFSPAINFIQSLSPLSLVRSCHSESGLVNWHSYISQTFTERLTSLFLEPIGHRKRDYYYYYYYYYYCCCCCCCCCCK